MKDINGLIFDPPAISTATVNSIEASKKDPTSLDIGIPTLHQFVMARKSKVIGMLGDTSHGKTSVMTLIAREMAGQIDAANGEIGVYITWEDNIEDFGLSDLANMSKIPLASLYHGDVKEHEFNRLIRASADRAKTPLWLVGHSESSGARARMTMTDVWEAMDNLQNKQKRKIRFVMMDYLQRINRGDMRGEGEARLQFSGIMDSIKDLSLAYQPAVFIGSQVSRSKVESSKWRQPQIHWAMETSNFEHTCDGALSVWMPYKSKDVWSEGDCLQEKQGIDGTAIFVRKETMLIEILKQKKAEAQLLKAVDFLPEYNMIVPYNAAANARAKIEQEIGNA
jgi:hypothetical protein